MMEFELLLLRILKTLVVILGSVLIYHSTKSYRKTKGKNMLFLAIGFAIMTIGSVLAGLSFELLGLSLRQVSIVETIMIVIGFIMSVSYTHLRAHET